MKEYGDEAFIRMLQENQEEAKNQDIRQGSIFVEDQELFFQEHEILKGRSTSVFPTGRKKWNLEKPKKYAIIWAR